MLDLEIIQAIQKEDRFELDGLYQFYFNTAKCPDNMLRTWNQEIHCALEVASGLVIKIQDAYAKSMTPDEEGIGYNIDVELALKSSEFKQYINASCELEKVDLENLTAN
jgi:hypothetical protein